VQRWICVSCKKQFQTPINAPTNDLPKILLFDIETSPMEVYVWGLYKQFISHNNIIKDKNGNEKSWYVLSWAAKWLYDDDVMSDIVTPEETKERNDKRVLKSIWKLFDEADIVIAHNGDRFDIRKLNARFIEHEMNPPTPYKSIDTLKIARKEFAFVSYKQDYLTKHFKLNQKLSTEFQLWVDCINGNQERLDEMVEYNRHDVMGLEQVYLKLRPYIKNHPNLGVLMDMDVCPSCGCEFIDQTEANYFTGASRFTVYRCQGCKTPYIRHKQNSNYVKTNLRSVSK
jgi:DNA polymerase elongation subunit (family B)|tara:strand:+ start:5728 stop:6582 length:855 start_codon:yes stop_codon:yes gene_type:complete